MSKRRRRNDSRLASAVCRIGGLLILFAVIASVAPITVPRFMGYEIYNVITGSMEPEIPVGSVAYVQPTDPVELTEGDIVAFTSNGSVVMHRVMSNHMVEGYLVTKGDANEQEDLEELPYVNVRGRVVKHYPMLGQVMMIYSSSVGKVLLLCLAACGAILNILAGRV